MIRDLFSFLLTDTHDEPSFVGIISVAVLLGTPDWRSYLMRISITAPFTALADAAQRDEQCDAVVIEFGDGVVAVGDLGEVGNLNDEKLVVGGKLLFEAGALRILDRDFVHIFHFTRQSLAFI